MLVKNEHTPENLNCASFVSELLIQHNKLRSIQWLTGKEMNVKHTSLILEPDPWRFLEIGVVS